MNGIFVSGILGSATRKERNFDGKNIVNFVYLVLVDDVAIRITSDYDYRERIKFGDEVTFKVTIRSYNNIVYYHGEYITDEDIE